MSQEESSPDIELERILRDFFCLPFSDRLSHGDIQELVKALVSGCREYSCKLTNQKSAIRGLRGRIIRLERELAKYREINLTEVRVQQVEDAIAAYSR